MVRQSLWVGTNIADRYCITGEIGGGGMGRVYSAIPFSDPSQTVAIKVIERTRLDYEDVLRFQREAALMSRLRHPNIIAFHELGLYKPRGTDGAQVVSGYYIVMEVAQGHDLKDSLVKGGRKRLDFFFELGLQVSAALEYTHAKSIIHRDIKPQNIIIERSNDSEGGLLVKVLDFGIARLTELDLYSDNENAIDIAGTPLYMAPENSKFLDAPIDHRVDLYSLGCVLYEVLAGRPPFTGNTREKLAREHAQAAPEPLTLIRPDVPDVVNDIVMKLMAKHPKDRYQTAFGVHVDLQRVKKMLMSGRGRSQRFILGRYDRLNILPATVPMVGRQTDFDILVSNYSAIAKDTSRSRLVVVRGAGGTGKTRLLKEFRGYLAKNKIRYISTSFSRHENNLPFNALANGFNEYLVHVYKTQPIEAEEIRRKVRALLGPTANLVAQIVQGLKPYLSNESEGPQPTDIDLTREVDFADFAKAFSDFTRCLATEQEPVAFFFDDMHWADDQSLELIDRFLSHNNSQRFLLIITHRTAGVQMGQSFQSFLTKFSKLRRRYQEIDMGPLALQASMELSRSILNLSRGPDPSFATYIQEKSSGNPLYLLELHRSLVFQELLSLDEQGRWRIELEEIKKSDLMSNSIDLLLNRLNEMEEADRRILEIAAIIGVQFTSDILQALPETDTLRISRVLGRAMNSGLLIMAPDQRNIGGVRAYAFTHRSIREALVDGMAQELRCEIHRLVALRIEGNGNLSRAQVIFNLAHHFFHASRAASIADPMLMEKALDYNMKAGMKALEIDSKLTAQRYLENARMMLPLLQKDSRIHQTAQKKLYHALADIHFAQREYGDAVKLYQELRQMKLSSVEFAYVAYKMTHLNLVSGHVNATLKELSKSFAYLKFPSVKMDFWNYIRGVWQLASSVLLPLQKTLPLRALSRATVPGEGKTAPFHPLSLYLVGQNAAFNFDKRLAMVYHSTLLSETYEQRVPEELVLRVICDHAIILSYLGFQQRAYQFLEVVFEVAKQKDARALLGYATFQQTLLVDQYQGKLEDIRYNLDLIQSSLQGQDYQLQAMQERIFRIVTFLFCGQGKELTKIFQTLPAMLTTRHWLTTKAVGMYLFWLLLADSRELIVSYGSFVKKKSTHSRPDSFTKIIEAIVSLAAGEREHAKGAYYNVLKNFRDDVESPWLLPYEIDFILLFLGFFPDVFAAEYGDDLLADERLVPVLRRTLSIASHRRHKRRAVPMLMRARLMEIIGEKKVKLFYDIALKRTKITQQPLVEVITRIWFGRHLSQERAMIRVDYFDMADDLARKMQLDLIGTLLRKVRKNLGQPVAPSKVVEDFVETDGEKEEQTPKKRITVDPLLIQHMALIPHLNPSETDLEVAKSEVFELLRQRLSFEGVYLLTVRDIVAFEEVGRPPVGKLQELIQYVSPYMNLRSSLTIPVGDAPWMQGLSVPYRPTVRTNALENPKGPMPNVTAFADETNIDKTAVLPMPGVDQGKPEEQKNNLDEALVQRSMNILVPVRYADQGLGILFLEASRIQDEDSTQLRQTLDAFGAQAGIWLRPYLPMETKPEELPILNYGAGAYTLEPCPWLHMWTEGVLRNARESVWYLGVNVSASTYLTTYCRINGPEELRGPLSSLLWHEMLSLRTLFTGTGADHLTPDDVQDAIERLLKSFGGVDKLEGITFSFSILHRNSGEVWSGHFGPARPLLLGSENNVTPLNRAILTLGNDRQLRYWKVQATHLQKGIFILPHDSSKLDRLDVSGLMESNFEGLTWDQKRWAFIDYLKANLVEGQVPRYFVAAAWNSPQQGNTTNAGGLEKAG